MLKRIWKWLTTPSTIREEFFVYRCSHCGVRFEHAVRSQPDDHHHSEYTSVGSRLALRQLTHQCTSSQIGVGNVVGFRVGQSWPHDFT